MARRKKEAISAHRDKITSAADILFSEKGVDPTTVDEIAKVSGYSKATLYVYFENKDEIYFDLVFRHMEALYLKIAEIAVRGAASAAEFTENYLEVCFYVLGICRKKPVYFEGMIGHINVDVENEETPQIYRDIYGLGLHINDKLKQMIRQGAELGVFASNTDIDAAIIFLWSGLTGIIRMSGHKKKYYKLLGFDNDEFLKKEFLMLLNCFKNAEGRLL